MLIKFEPTGSHESFSEIISAFDDNPEIHSLIIFSCIDNNYTPEIIDPILKYSRCSIVGAAFPKIIYLDKVFDTGAIFVGLEEPLKSIILPNLEDTPDFELIIEEQVSKLENSKTVFLFVDGMFTRIGLLLQSMFNVIGLDFNYIGGGAGSLSFKSAPCIFSNFGFLGDCAVIGASGLKSYIGVSHGWSEVSSPYKVTESDGNIIKSLDWIPAMELYAKVVEEHSGKKFDRSNFFEIAKNYPFGIAKFNSEFVARAPLFPGENNSIACAGEVPQGEFVHILCGTPDTLVKAAKSAFISAQSSKKMESAEGLTILIDCISRYLFLGDEFVTEINTAQTPGVKLIGALTLGEIANSQKDYLEFYNNTIVICNMDFS